METQLPLPIGRYELHGEIASGGMAIVHLGRLRGDEGFARAVAIKRLHRQYVGDPELTALLLDEARLASRLQHPNVIAPQDLVTSNGEIFIVMEYVHGLTLAALVREARARGELVPIAIASRVMSDVLAGLHAAHGAKDGQGRPLALVHRDVSPQNVMVGADGLARVLDFGIAQAAFRSQTTRQGILRAKLAYAAPEHVLDGAVDRRADVYSAAIVAWEVLTLERLFTASNEGALLARVLEQVPPHASKRRPELPPALDVLLASALSKRADERPATAEDFALELERISPPATHREVARWMASLGGAQLELLAARRAEVEAGGTVAAIPTATPTGTAFAKAIDTRTSDVRMARLATGLPDPRTRERRSSRLRLAVLGLTLGALAIAPALIVRSPWHAPPAPAVQAASLDPAGAPETDHVLVAALPAAPASAGPDAASPQAPAIALPAASAQKRATPPASARSFKSRPTPPGDDCAHLTEVDSQGIRRVKRQCLR